MDASPRQPSHDVDHLGLRCRHCGHQRFRVIYTRAGRGGTIIRRRACRRCDSRLTTWEKAVGG